MKNLLMLNSVPELVDEPTRAWIEDVVYTLPKEFVHLSHIILFGSVARGEQRPIIDKYPSDVDLFLIFQQEAGISDQEFHEVFVSLGQIALRHHNSVREIKPMFGTPSLREWDETFIENVASEGIVLFAKSSLPAPLQALARQIVAH